MFPDEICLISCSKIYRSICEWEKTLSDCTITDLTYNHNILVTWPLKGKVFTLVWPRREIYWGLKKKAENDLNKQVTIKVKSPGLINNTETYHSKDSWHPLLMLMESWRLRLLLSIPPRALCFAFTFHSNRQSTFCSTCLAGLMMSTITLATGWWDQTTSAGNQYATWLMVLMHSRGTWSRTLTRMCSTWLTKSWNTRKL